MHSGHRARLVGKIKDGSTLYGHELMEAVLFNSCPRRDVNDAAHGLIDRFKTVRGALSAPEKELVKVDGVGENMAAYLSVLGKCLSRCADVRSFTVINSTADFASFISCRKAENEDELELCILDKDGRLRRVCTVYGEGGRVRPSTVVIAKFVSVYNAYGLFVAYRRVAGGCEPTAEDDALVGQIKEVCRVCGTKLYDYCIAGADGGVFSYFVTDRIELAPMRSGGA